MTPSSSFDPANPFPTQNDFNLVIAQFSQPQAHAGGSQQDNGNGNGESSRQPHRRQGIPVGEEDNDRNNDELRDLMKRKEAMLSGWEYRNRAIHPVSPPSPSHSHSLCHLLKLMSRSQCVDFGEVSRSYRINRLDGW